MDNVLSDDEVLKRILNYGWPRPSPIQKKALPVIIRKKNALLVAPTGSGKTEAAVIPIFALISRKIPAQMGVKVIYITPLRALNRDIFRRIIRYASDEGLVADIRHGDTPVTIRQKMIQKPPDVLITTPETLAILLTSRKMSLHLKTLEWVIVDELHEMIGNERGAHLSLSLERLDSLSTLKIVRVGLSATLGDLDGAAKFLVGKRRKCAVLVDSSVRKYDIRCRHIQGHLSDVTIEILRCIEKEIELGHNTLLFTNTRDEAEYLSALIKKESPDIQVEVHHGSLSREIREETEKKLRTGKARLVVSTSSLELGLDIGGVDLVMQLGSPRQALKLIQRVGRSKHRLGEEAKGLVITNKYDDELECLALIKKISQGKLEKIIAHHGSLDVLVHHLAGLAIEKGQYRVSDALSLVQQSFPFSKIVSDDLETCLRLLERQGIIRYDGETVRRRGAGTYRYYYDNISTIPDVQQFNVVDVVHRKNVGRLDQVFIGEYGEPGRTFVLKGSSWKIISINDDEKSVHVEPAPTDIPNVPYWVGELIPVDFDTSQEVGRLRRAVIMNEVLDVSTGQKDRLLRTREILGITPDNNFIVTEENAVANTLVVHACFGTRINQTIAMLLSTLISSEIGHLVEAKSDAYRILLTSYGNLSSEHVIRAFSLDIDINHILAKAIVGTHILNWKTWHVAKKFGIVNRDAQYDRRTSRLIQMRYSHTPLYKEVLRELFLEKYDVDETMELLSMIRKGSLKIETRQVNEFTPLARPILEYASSFAALPLSVEKSVLKSVKERLLNTKHKLICLTCGKWERVLKTMEMRDKITCPLCHSRIVSATYLSDEELVRLVQRNRQGKTLTKGEAMKMRKAWKVSSLIQNFGELALMVLSGFGVGPETAGRILRNDVGDEDQLLKNIYRAEKLYVSTRGFWAN